MGKRLKQWQQAGSRESMDRKIPETAKGHQSCALGVLKSVMGTKVFPSLPGTPSEKRMRNRAKISLYPHAPNCMCVEEMKSKKQRA